MKNLMATYDDGECIDEEHSHRLAKFWFGDDYKNELQQHNYPVEVYPSTGTLTFTWDND